MPQTIQRNVIAYDWSISKWFLSDCEDHIGRVFTQIQLYQ